MEEKPVNGKPKVRVLLTGDRGFIASRLAARLRAMDGYDVLGYDIATGQDILDLGQLEQAVLGCDVVYHTAAQADLTVMSRSVEDGYRGARLNVEGTHNVAYLCAKHGKRLIYASTVCVYGNVREHPEMEDETLPNPSELYSCSKYAGELLVKGYGLNYGMRWTALRFATIYGPGMRPALGLHIFLRQAMAGEPITVHGDGSQDRTLTYVEDLVDGCVAALERPDEANGQIINLTASVAVSARQMAEDAQAVAQSESPVVFVAQRPNQTIHEDFDTTKAKQLLGWEAKTPWKDGLAATYAWMKAQNV